MSEQRTAADGLAEEFELLRVKVRDMCSYARFQIEELSSHHPTLPSAESELRALEKKIGPAILAALRRADPKPDAAAKTAGLVDDDDLLRSVGLLFFDAMSVRCEPRSYARRCIQLVQERIAALHAPAPTTLEPPVWRHDFNAYVPVQRSARSEANEAVAQQDVIRELAVGLVDCAHGYTMEFSNSPAAHRAEYDDTEENLRIVANTLRITFQKDALDATRGKS